MKYLTILFFIPVFVFAQSKKEIIQKQQETINSYINQLNELKAGHLKLKKEKIELNVKLKKIQEASKNKQIEIEKLKKELFRSSSEQPEEFTISFINCLKYRDEKNFAKLIFSNSDTLKLTTDFRKDAKWENNKLQSKVDILNIDIHNFLTKLHYDDLAPNWDDPKIGDVNYETEYNDFGVVTKRLSIHYVKGNSPYVIKVLIILIDKHWKLLDDEIDFIDLEKEKKEKEKKEKEKLISAFTPWQLRIGGATWSYNDETFSDFNLNISNNSDDYIFEKVKFYFSLTNSFGTKVFARTFTIELGGRSGWGYDENGKIILPSKLSPGDVYRFEVPGLYDFYLGEKIQNQDDWDYEIKVIDSWPKAQRKY
tara:strand:- start:540 stop:1640 length:1101 start_codon:yes stop_codon:yes gene_type:complete